MAPQAKDTQPVAFRQAIAPLANDDFQQLVRDTMRDFVRLALTTILEEEVTALIGAAPYEQNPVRRDHRNGAYTRDLVTSVGRLEACRARGAASTRRSLSATNAAAAKWTKALARCLCPASAPRASGG